MNATSIELPSQIFYHYLNFFNEEYKQHYKECKSLNTPHNKDMKIIRTCEKLVNYLKTNYEEEENKGDLKDHHCNLLSYWIYEQLDKKIKSGFHAILPTYAEYQMILSYVLNGPNASQAHKCLRNVSVFAFDNWKERKDLYDYCVDYDKIIKLADTSYEKCKKYEKYIQEKSPLYEKFDNLYIPEYKKKNPGFYKKCKGYNPEIVIGELKCDVKFSEERSKGDSHGQGLSGSTFFSGQNSDSTKTFGNVFLGVVVTSMTSGMLYKVNKY
ncbi:hypothetical protein PVBG_06075 [Plasmodium vivax Brazil I]|uniref:VIR protein n=1 Tax=Plasmodium vivax (strain Brazil I) TaxID=1033975 RepID=A0A0J9VNW9_PLAV1|nr:hypothetical protein PVBG_06075 [Plasmodium vivax Brazil I]